MEEEIKMSEIALDGLGEAISPAAKPGRTFQFTTTANRRVKFSYYEDELRTMVFAGRTGVDLLEVELAILALDQQVDGRRSGLAVDEEYGSELADCDVGSEDVCVEKFLPTVWDGKPGSKYQAGYFTPDLAVPGEDDAPLAVCYPCRKAVNAEFARANRQIEEKNKKLLEAGKEPEPPLPFPRYMSLRDAEEAYARKTYAVNKKKERQAAAHERWEKGTARRQGFLGRVRTSAQAIAWAKKRYGGR